MMKFASFETIVEAIYNYLPGSKNDYGKGAQTAVAFTGGYLAGILCAVVSHPADVMVSKLNAERAPGEGFGAAMSRIYAKIGFPASLRLCARFEPRLRTTDNSMKQNIRAKLLDFPFRQG